MYAGLTRMVRDEFGRRPLETGRQSAFTGYWGFSGARTPAYVIVSVRPSSVVSVEFALLHRDVLARRVFRPNGRNVMGEHLSNEAVSASIRLHRRSRASLSAWLTSASAASGKPSNHSSQDRKPRVHRGQIASSADDAPQVCKARWRDRDADALAKGPL